MARRTRRPSPDLELRVMVDGQVIIGPVQAMRLEAIRAAGSIAAAQRHLGASYADLRKLVAAFAPPLVEPIRGGARGGGAMLTEQGHKVLDSFRLQEGLSKSRGHEELLVIGQATSHAVAKRQ